MHWLNSVTLRTVSALITTRYRYLWRILQYEVRPTNTSAHLQSAPQLNLGVDWGSIGGVLAFGSNIYCSSSRLKTLNIFGSNMKATFDCEMGDVLSVLPVLGAFLAQNLPLAISKTVMLRGVNFCLRE
jgi:hypothetical protein